MDSHIARQPILDNKKNLYGYELLFRDGSQNAMPDGMDGDTATSQLLSSSFFTIGIDTLTNGKYAFINFTEKLITQGIPRLFPCNRTIIEVLETVPATQEVITALTAARAQGYIVALDDYVFNSTSAPLLQVADIIKVDLMATPVREVKALAKMATERGITLLAEKVETKKSFEWVKNLGFSLFQGYFFCRPEIISGKEIPAESLTLLKLMAELHQPDADLHAIEALISRDVAITFKLLCHLNSAWYGLKRPISSLIEALRMLGLDEIRRLVGLIAMSRITSKAPRELLRLSAVRGRLCELASHHSSMDTEASEFFALGIFSLIDTILNRPMVEVMTHLPLPPTTISALTRGEGPMAPFLQFINAFEHGEWEDMSQVAQRIRLPEARIGGIITDTLIWAGNIPI